MWSDPSLTPSSRRIFWLALLTFLTAALVFMGICGVLYLQAAGEIEKTQRDRESRRVEIFTHLFQRDIQSAITDLQVLADSDGLRAFLASGQQADLDRALHRAVFVSHQEPDYDQIRYLDQHGQEILRVNANGTVVPKDQLQNKADRSYFQKALVLAPGQIFISAFDLNVENGRIEQPLKPMIRFATPIFDAKGQRRGEYIINYRGANLIKRLQQFIPQNGQRLRILNAQGYWLKAAQPNQEWGFMFPDRKGTTLVQGDPSLWARIVHEPNGQESQAGGLFTWYRLVPREIATSQPNILVSDDDFLVIASEVSKAEWDGLFSNLRRIFIIFTMVLLLLGLTCWWFFYAHLQAEEILKQSEQRLRLMIECIKDYAIIMLDSGGRVVSWNEGAQRIKGYETKEIVGQHFSRFYPENRICEGKPEEMLRVAAAEDRVEDEGWRLRKDGSRFWANVVITAIRSRDGRLLGFVKITRDLTQHKRAEEKILALNEDLRHRAEQLEVANKELESFSYSVSHDLRAPLRHIHGFVELLQKSPTIQGDEESRRRMNVVGRAAKQMGLLIDDLLSFSRTGRAEMHPLPVDMRKMIDQIIQELELDGKERRVVWDIKPLPSVTCDPALLRLVWTNLLANAFKFTRPRALAKIEIGTLFDRENDLQAGETVFYVRDNGVGFDMQYASKLFGVFQRLHRMEDFEGTGIGLANVQRIILRHGGRVWAEGQLEVGATFYFSLPTSQPKNPHA